MSKRVGLGKASKTKKAKLEPQEEPEITIDLPQNVNDEELAEIYGLYAKLKADRDTRLAKGLVNECNALLKARDEKDQTLPAKFHFVFAGSLFSLQDMEFVDAAINRLKTGLTSKEDVGVAVYELIVFAHTQLKNGKLSKDGKTAFKLALELVNDAEVTLELAEAVDLLVSLEDELGKSSKLEVLKKITKSTNDEISKLGYKALAQNQLTKLAPEIERLEDENDEVDLSIFDGVVKNLRKALTEKDASTYVMLAETLLYLDDVDEAVKLMKKARILGYEGLEETIEELEG